MEKESQKIFVSTISSYFARFSVLLIGFLTKIFLARLLFPKDFGLFAVAMAIYALLQVLMDLGISDHLERERETKDAAGLFGNALLIELFMAVLLIALVQVFAPFLSIFYPLVPELVRVLALGLIPYGVSLIAFAHLHRELRIERVILPEIAQSLTYATVGILLAWRGLGVWSLIYAQLVAVTFLAVFLYFSVLRKMTFRFTLNLTRLLLKGGLPLFALIFLGTLEGRVDKGILGLLVSEKHLGLYFFAVAIAYLPTRFVGASLGRVLFPAFARAKEDLPYLRTLYKYSSVLLAAIKVPVAAFLFVNAPLLVSWVLGTKWLPVVPYLRMIVFLYVVNPFTASGFTLLMSLRQDRVIVGVRAVMVAHRFVLGFILTRLWGVPGMILTLYLAVLWDIFLILRLVKILGAKSVFFGDYLLIYPTIIVYLVLAALIPNNVYLLVATGLLTVALPFVLERTKFKGIFSFARKLFLEKASEV